MRKNALPHSSPLPLLRGMRKRRGKFFRAMRNEDEEWKIFSEVTTLLSTWELYLLSYKL